MEKNEQINQEREEFNMMSLYLRRLDLIQAGMDEAAGENDVVKYYLELRSLLSNTEFKLEDENIDYSDVKSRIIAMGKVIHNAVTHQSLKKNSYQHMERCIELGTDIRRLINKAGIIYPKVMNKPLKQMAKEDY